MNPALLRGRPLRIAVNDVRRETFDATVEIYFPRLLTSGKRKFTKGFYRLIGRYDTDKSKYHFYMTNIPAQLLAAEDAYNVYRVRWEIELIFKELKSGYGLGGITSCSKADLATLGRKPRFPLLMLWPSHGSLLEEPNRIGIDPSLRKDRT